MLGALVQVACGTHSAGPLEPFRGPSGGTAPWLGFRDPGSISYRFCSRGAEEGTTLWSPPWACFQRRKIAFGGASNIFLRLSRGPRLLAVGQFPRAAGSPLGRDHGEAENVDTSSLVPQACAPMCLECDLAPAGSGNAACCEEPHRGRRVLRADVVKQRRQPQHRAVPGCCSAAPGRLCAATILHSCVTWPAAHARSGKVWCPMY